MAEGSPTRVAVYARVSRPDEAGILENQLGVLRAYVRERGFSPAGEYVEVVSGASSDRPGLNRLLEDATRQRGRPFDLVVATSLSRLTRGGVEAALHILRRLEVAGVGWHLVEMPALNYDASTPPLARDIILSVLSAVDRDYRRRISQATRAAFQRRKALAAARGETVVWGRRRKATPLPIEGEGPVPA